ncbi:MAG: zinc ribbon domain-containing protein [Deltaproteobacteria bacterium]|nr:zinc ribbon domain-containing protein [Deltaproteobacteria bacterium]
MPTYEYQCDACNKGFIREQRITEKPVKKCPHCGKMKARRMISGGDFILKGGGWYSDLYSSTPKGSSKKDTGSSSGGSDD